MISTARIVGAGLIGTSIGLCLKSAGVKVEMVDVDSNSAQLAWGTSGAKPVAVSFWVKATVTGTYSFTLYNDGASRICPSSYTVTASNTWEKKTVYIVGDTSGTWLTTTGRGVVCNFYIALGTNYLGTSGVWNGSSIYGVTGQANALASTSNIFAITGVQLEQNYQPTPFEQRPIGTELELCQRYYETSYDLGTAPATATEAGALYSGCSNANALDGGSVRFRVPKRATPTVRTFNTFNGGNNQVTEFTENPRTYITPRSIAHLFIGTTGYVVHGNQQLASGRFYSFHYEASAEL